MPETNAGVNAGGFADARVLEFPRPWEVIEFDGQPYVSDAHAEIVCLAYTAEAADLIVALANREVSA